MRTVTNRNLLVCLFAIRWASSEFDRVLAFSSTPPLFSKRIPRAPLSSLGVSATPTESLQIQALSSSQEPKKNRKRKAKLAATGTNKKKADRGSEVPQPAGQLRSLGKMNVTPKPPSGRDKGLLLTREEEKELTRQIRRFRKCVRVRDEIASEHSQIVHAPYQPSEEEWADACGVNVVELRKIMINGQDARSRIVESNGGLVGSIAKRYYRSVTQANEANNGVGTILSFSDLIQEGNLGLMEAAERFEPERNFRFSTYATWWVRQRMLKAISDYSRIIRLPTSVYTLIRKVRKARKEMEKETGRQPSDREISRYLGITAEKVRLCDESMRTVLSLEQPIRGNNRKPDEKATTLGEFLSSDAPSPEENAEHQALRETLLSVIEELKPKEKDVLIARYGLDDGSPKTVEETSRRIGLSRDRVRAVEAQALNKLRNPVRNHRLKSYVEDDDYEESNETALTPEQIWSF